MPRPPRPSLEARARKLLATVGIKGIPVPVDRIARALGARVRYSALDEELSGFIYIKDGIPIIGVNALHHPNRQRFTIAHEIAHLQLHPQFIKNEVHVDKKFSESILRRDTAATTGTERLEVDANQFAAALLMPAEFLQDADCDVEDEREIEQWAKESA